ncbi:MAG: hypothetical protein A2729_04690 [Candidatus Buchananbacteria bacterium RIFCSPHIGHO2_01_FULL_39_14]|uniref:Phosphoribosyl-ATP pyrophosphohydrolase n=1 Tax=Candidatus Buchananbacteria bacterium RIFCSPHIGHO2_01_FULL_39_14 TaxID=1797532 RepID=A0A1G1XU16_9BACT|nr:MAG: hypothetical protein A2729_04690 [Candidatus Buchananbacteria bacterium RIFCSPHIGHO2_01_FULL_39_14]OGY49279.1 MAG: hypothetical protein A3D39_03015 [Candidatus Buchananbacteria bacterium RIFCSPHIGHO2_02_FULL_39_17]
MKIYHKLVCDKIPEICKKDDEKPVYYVLSQKRFREELKKKLIEETEELTRAKKSELKNEIIDVYEILLNLARVNRLKWSTIEKHRLEKNKPDLKASFEVSGRGF